LGHRRSRRSAPSGSEIPSRNETSLIPCASNHLRLSVLLEARTKSMSSPRRSAQALGERCTPAMAGNRCKALYVASAIDSVSAGQAYVRSARWLFHPPRARECAQARLGSQDPREPKGAARRGHLGVPKKPAECGARPPSAEVSRGAWAGFACSNPIKPSLPHHCLARRCAVRVRPALLPEKGNARV